MIHTDDQTPASIIHVAVDWERIDSAFRTLDAARKSASGVRLGDDGLTDALGGSYHPRRGLAGLAYLARALDRIADAAWKYIHRAADMQRRETSAAYAHAAWVIETANGCYLLDRRSQNVRGFASHRGAAIVARRKRGRVRSASDVLAARLAIIHDQARAAVRTLLAVHDAYAALEATGIVPPGEAGHNGRTLFATGLRWLAGAQREDHPVSVSDARVFADGAPVELFAPSKQ